MKYTTQKHGFTLIEILLAIVIFAIVISAVYSTYKITFDTIHSAENKLTHAIIATHAFECISEDLKNLPTESAADFTAQATNTNQRAGIELSFMSTHKIITQPEDEIPGTYLVRYTTIYDDESGLLQLYRSSIASTTDLEENNGLYAKGWLIADQLQSVHLLYLDDDENEQEQWNPKEDVTETQAAVLPKMIRIKLEFAQPSKEGDGEIFTTAVSLGRGKKP